MEQDRHIFNGEIWIKNDRIVYVGENKVIERFGAENQGMYIHWDKEVDCEGNLMGFKEIYLLGVDFSYGGKANGGGFLLSGKACRFRVSDKRYYGNI